MTDNVLTEVLVEPSNYKIYRNKKPSLFYAKSFLVFSLFASFCFTLLIISYINNRENVHENIQVIYDQQTSNLMILSSINNTITFCIYMFLM